MISKYIGPQPSGLNIALEGAEAGVLACMYPTEAQVSLLQHKIGLFCYIICR